MENELTVQGGSALTARDIRAQVNLIQEVMKAVMKKDVHYGVIPGCPKPSLLKPGAEKIATTFRITVISEPPEDLSSADERRFRITCTAKTPDGRVLGSSLGECSTSEEKYKWRRPVCDQEFEEADADRKREKWVKDKTGKGIKIKQIRTEPADLSNTILQMADKRAYVAVVRKVTAASDVFTQDIEDLPPEIQQEIVDTNGSTSTKPAVEMPKSKSETTQPPAADPYPSAEPEAKPGDVISEAQGKRLYAIARDAGMSQEQFKFWLITKFGYELTKHILKDEYEKICEAAKGWKRG